MILYFAIYFINHLNRRIKLNDYIVESENGIIDISLNKLYATASFVTQNVYYAPEIIGDMAERVEILYKIDNNPIQTHKFVIDGIDYLPNNQIRVYFKTKGVIAVYKYSGVNNYTAKTTSLKRVLEELLGGLELDFEEFTDRYLPFYIAENKSIDEIIKELSELYGFEYYYSNGKIVFKDKKGVEEDYSFSFTEDNILSLSTSTNKEEKRINKITFNEKIPQIIDSQIKLDINPSPQPASPNEVLRYVDNDGKVYKIYPKQAVFTIYLTKSSLLNTLKIDIKGNVEYEKKENFVLIEKISLKNESFFFTTAFIKELIDIKDSEGNYIECEIEDNLVKLKEEFTGEINISYKTDLFKGVVGSYKYPNKVTFNLTAEDVILNYEHKIELNGYYPIPYTLKVNLMKNWGVSYQDALNKEIKISKYIQETDAFVEIARIRSDNFGEFDFNISEYALYKFETSGYEPLYLFYFVNKFEFCMDEKE